MDDIEEIEVYEVSQVIKTLEMHVSNKNKLPMNVLYEKLDYLLKNYAKPVYIDTGKLTLLRAREHESPFKSVDELSYLKKTEDKKPSIGRANMDGESIFYACINNSELEFNDELATSFQINNTDICQRLFKVTLSEVRALDNKKYSLLVSQTNEKMKLAFIGIYSYFLLGQPCPHFLDMDFFEKNRKEHENSFYSMSDKKFMCIQLVDYFLADVFSRDKEQNPNLYDVTSYVSKKLINHDDCDGILFASIQAKGEPVVAIKPESVDKKVMHRYVYLARVEKSLGYFFYKLKLSDAFGAVAPNGAIQYYQYYNLPEELKA